MSDDPGEADASDCCMEEDEEGAKEDEDEDADGAAAGWSWSPHAASNVHASTAPHSHSLLIDLLGTSVLWTVCVAAPCDCEWRRERASQRIGITRVEIINL